MTCVVECAGKVLIAIRADIAERCRDAIGHGQRRYCPDLTVERIGAAMQRIGTIVGDQVIGLAVQRELRTADAVGVAAGDRAEMAGATSRIPANR